MHPDDDGQRRAVTVADLGKEVVTCYGALVGTVSGVDERDRRIRVDAVDGGADLLEPAADELERVGSTIQLLAEHVEFVTSERVWLRI